jgi:hypothetical protein
MKNLASHFNINLDKTVLITNLYEELRRCQRLSEATFPKYLYEELCRCQRSSEAMFAKYLLEQELFRTEVLVVLDVLIHFFHKCWIIKDSQTVRMKFVHVCMCALTAPCISTFFDANLAIQTIATHFVSVATDIFRSVPYTNLYKFLGFCSTCLVHK